VGLGLAGLGPTEVPALAGLADPDGLADEAELAEVSGLADGTELAEFDGLGEPAVPAGTRLVSIDAHFPSGRW